jgi:hypothetical protein
LGLRRDPPSFHSEPPFLSITASKKLALGQVRKKRENGTNGKEWNKRKRAK